MKLKSISLANFRGYKNQITINLDDLTTLIGRNDAGKSTLLDALDVFFNDKALDKNDASKGGNSKAVSITCVFGNLPDELVLDETVPTNLGSEYLLNADGNLEITKIYNCSIEKPKLTSLYLNIFCPAAEKARDLISLKIEELKIRAEEVGVDMGTVNKTVKRDLRAAIRSKVGPLHPIQGTLSLIGEEVNEKGNAVKVWDGLKSALPLYALFKSDRQSSDQDAEAQDPLKTAIKEAIAIKAPQLQEVMSFVEQEVKKVADLTLKKLREMDASIAATLDPKFEKPNWSTLIKASITGDDEIPLNKRGSGVRRLILLNFFRAKAERMIHEKSAQSTIYAIEEPETSQHPHNQRLLMSALQQLAIADDQVIITTHTPMLARSLPSSSLRFLSKTADGERKIDVGGSESVNQSIADSLGVLPDHTVKMFIIVEGIHDVTFFKSLSKLFLSLGTNVPDLEALEISGQIVFVPASGASNLALWSSRLAALNRPEFHLYDRDSASNAPAKHQEKVNAVNQRLSCKGLSTSRLEMENYIHHEAMNIANPTLNLVTPFGHDDDVPKLLTAMLNVHAPQSSKWGESRVKGWLAATVLQKMDARMLAEVDPANEMLGWMRDIEQMLA
ncbi:ATP-binding protein [Comamonas testosteroni]|uniref:ATP-binding protein n=1 Tax=Comamonas testosteroni TaxID=285 RepID=UPI0006A62824|nr:ATP-binding protein [Comamonas testosteroni]KWT66424.1 putative ATP-dependent endonuclease, OLD family [Comamonas testosteroni]